MHYNKLKALLPKPVKILKNATTHNTLPYRLTHITVKTTRNTKLNEHF